MGGSKPEAEASTATSPFDQMKSYNVNLGGFTNASATNNGKSIDVNSALASPLSGLYKNAAQGAANNASFLSMNPYQQLEQLDAGNNPFYNLQSHLNDSALKSAMGTARIDAQRRGMSDSTSAGAMQGRILNDAVLRDLSTRNESLQTQNAVSLQNAQVLQNILNNLYNYQAGGANAAQQGLMQGLLDKSHTARHNASLETDVSIKNAQMQGSGGGFMSQILPTVGTIAGSALGGPLGAKIGGGLGNMVGGMFGGGSGAMSTGASTGPFRQNYSPIQSSPYYNSPDPYFYRPTNNGMGDLIQ